MEKMLHEHPGKCRIKFTVHDRVENLVVEMPSKSVSVNLSKEFFEELEKLKKWRENPADTAWISV
jgi:hypothetical protein